MKDELLALAERMPSEATQRMCRILGAKWVWKDSLKAKDHSGGGE